MICQFCKTSNPLGNHNICTARNNEGLRPLRLGNSYDECVVCGGGEILTVKTDRIGNNFLVCNKDITGTNK